MLVLSFLHKELAEKGEWGSDRYILNVWCGVLLSLPHGCVGVVVVVVNTIKKRSQQLLLNLLLPLTNGILI